MSFQAYLDTIRTKTGLGPEDFRVLARERGLLESGVKAGQIKAWLKEDYDLGPGHAMAIISIIGEKAGTRGSADDRIDSLFSGGKAHWRPVADRLVETLRESGREVALAPTDTYLSLVCEGRKFAILQPTAGRLDIGIKRPGVPPTERFEPAGSWNSMVTHRVRITDPAQLDEDVLRWLRAAHAGS
jgi:hypothetical protein